MQAKLRNFYDDFGIRIGFLRDKAGLTLGQLADGAASTAKSWEEGSRPTPDKWEPIAKRLNLTVSFVFLGRPTSKEDYDFIAKYADEVGPPPGGAPPVSPLVQEAAGHYGTAESLRAEIYKHVDELVAAAKGDPAKLGWIREQLHSHLVVPARWRAGVKLGQIQPKTEVGQPIPSASGLSRSA